MKVSLQKVRINSQGYTDSGQYFGTGAPLYFFCADDCSRDGWFRATDRSAAKDYVRNIIKDARFYN